MEHRKTRHEALVHTRAVMPAAAFLTAYVTAETSGKSFGGGDEGPQLPLWKGHCYAAGQCRASKAVSQVDLLQKQLLAMVTWQMMQNILARDNQKNVLPAENAFHLVL